MLLAEGHSVLATHRRPNWTAQTCIRFPNFAAGSHLARRFCIRFRWFAVDTDGCRPPRRWLRCSNGPPASSTCRQPASIALNSTLTRTVCPLPGPRVRRCGLTKRRVREFCSAALILRPAAIYGPGRGVHVSLRNGTHRLWGNGANDTPGFTSMTWPRCAPQRSNRSWAGRIQSPTRPPARLKKSLTSAHPWWAWRLRRRQEGCP